MAKKFEVVGDEALRTEFMSKEAGVTIAAGDLVAADSNGYAILATATSTAVAYAPRGAASADLKCEVTIGNDFILKGTGDAAFAITQKGTLVDITTTTQLIDVGESSIDVLKISPMVDAGVAGSTAGIKVKINKPLF